MGNTASYPPKVLVPLAGLLFSKNLSSSGQVPTLAHSSPFRWSRRKGAPPSPENTPGHQLRSFFRTDPHRHPLYYMGKLRPQELENLNCTAGKSPYPPLSPGVVARRSDRRG